jgi:hypothetical protein
MELIPFHRGSDYEGPIWGFPGTEACPTLTPSVRHSTGVNPDGIPFGTVCHYHLINGFLEYCNDCKHELNGKRVPLPEVKEEEWHR